MTHAPPKRRPAPLDVADGEPNCYGDVRMPKRIPWRPAAALLFLAGVVYLSRRPDVRALLEYDVLEAHLQSWRPWAETVWGPLAILVVSAAAVVVSFPLIAVIVAAGLLLPAPMAFAVTWLGGNLGALACYALARQLGDEPFFKRLRARWNHRLPQDRMTPGFMFWLRLTMFMASPVNWLPGLAGMPLRSYLIGNLFGMVPWVLGVMLVTEKIRSARALDATVLLQWELGALLGVSAMVALIAKRLTAKKAPPPEDSPSTPV